MALLGRAALAMWWDIAAELRTDFEDWHAHEHFPERLAIAGFRRGTRWSSAAGGEGMFVLYELEGHHTLASSGYLARLKAPTPWSTRLMPHHRNMVRGQCHVVASRGGVVARQAWTVRLSAAADRVDTLEAYLDSLVATLPSRPGLVGAHLLRHETPAIGATREQQIRNNADRSADWVFVACGYAAPALEALGDSELSAARLAEHGGAPDPVVALYSLATSAVGGDVE
jgi:hypothetical protein